MWFPPAFYPPTFVAWKTYISPSSKTTPSHLGKPIAEEAKQRSLRDESQFMGFFSKAALEEMLRPATCVGIRFYNAGGLVPEERKLIGVGVADDGSELNQTRGRGYFLSATRAAGGSDKKITKVQARALMLQVVRDRTPATKRPIRFTSYFSRTMMEQLLAPAGGNYLPKIHPTKTRAELWKQTAENGTLVKADVRMMVDRLAW